jgi:hypothetical protein
VTTVMTRQCRRVVEIHLAIDVLDAPPMVNDKGEEFVPAVVRLDYQRTNRQPWRFARVVVAADGPFALRVQAWSHQKKQVAALPPWVRDLIATHLPEETAR